VLLTAANSGQLCSDDRVENDGCHLKVVCRNGICPAHQLGLCVCVCPSTVRSSCNDAVGPATCPARIRRHVEKRPAHANVHISEKLVMSPVSMISP